MKILTLTFYKDFARYFEYVEREAEKRFIKIEFTNLVLYPCSYYYFINKRRSSTILPFTLVTKNINVDSNTIFYRDYNLDKLIEFSIKTLEIKNKYTIRQLKIRASAYINYYEKLLNQKDFSMIICSGDTRLPIEVCISVAKKYGIKIWYFEQGPFGTTIFDNVGVNANSSFSNKTFVEQKKNINDINKKIENIKNKAGGNFWTEKKRGLIERNIDWFTILLMHPPKIFEKILPMELRTGDYFIRFLILTIKNKFFYKIRINSEKSYIKKQKYITLILQVPFDAQMILHSPHYKTTHDIVKAVIDNSPDGYSIVIREHPLHIGMYETSVYQKVKESKNALIDNDTSLNKLIDNSMLVVVNNSTTGLDAMRRNKTVVVLGNAYYANDNVVYNLKKIDGLDSLLALAIKKPIAKELIHRHLNWIMDDCLIPGHYHDINLSNAKYIIRKIFKDLNGNSVNQ
jgi:capsular polysaccharide export protein